MKKRDTLEKSGRDRRIEFGAFLAAGGGLLFTGGVVTAALLLEPGIPRGAEEFIAGAIVGLTWIVVGILLLVAAFRKKDAGRHQTTITGMATGARNDAPSREKQEP